MRWPHAAFLLIATFALGNWQLLVGRGIEKWDAADLGTPYYSLLADFARSGRFLYWNPWMAAGSPDFAIAGSGTFSPDLLLFAALTGPGRTGFIAYWLVAWLAGGLGMLLLARHLRIPPSGGLVIALGFTFSGFYTGHAEHPGLLYAYSLLPWIVWRLDVALRRESLLVAAQAGALWGLSGLAGYPAFTIYSVGVIVFWALGRSFFSTSGERSSWLRSFLVLAVIGGVGLTVLSPSYVSAAYEGNGYSDRSGPLGREALLKTNALHPAALATLGSPAHPELKVASRELWSYTDVSCLSFYTGAATVVLALVALTNRRERRWRWWLAGLALFALACAMSRTFPFRGWMYDLLPPTRYFRHSGMLRGYFLFGLSILALYGWKDLTVAKVRRRRKYLIACLVSTGAALGSYTYYAAVGNVDQTNWPLAVTQLIVVWGGLLLVTLNRGAFPSGWVVAIALTDALFTASLGEGTVLDRNPQRTLPAPAKPSIALGPESFPRALGAWHENSNLQMKVPTLRNYAPFKNEFQEIIAAVPTFAEMALGRHRIWFAAEAPEVAPTGEAFARCADRMWELNAPVLVRHSRAMMLDDKLPGESVAQIKSLPAAVRVPSTIIAYEPEKLVLTVTTPSDGWVMISDRWARSWKATVNGVEQPVAGGNFIFRALRVAPGENRIEFHYEPLAVPALIVVSWGALAAIGGASAWQLARRRRRQPAHETFASTAVEAVAV